MALEAPLKLRPLADQVEASPELKARPLPVQSRYILGTRVDGTNYAGAVETITRWAQEGQSRYVCVSTVHMVMEGHDDPAYREIVNAADLVTSDGMPLVWGLRLLGVRQARRVYGPDLTPLVCERAAAEGIPVGFYGSSPEVLEAMTANLREAYPSLDIAIKVSPPFRELTPEEVEGEIEALRASGARIIFVGLGCPKQERWMHARRGKVDAVLIGVGAAFDYVGKTKAQAPRFMQAHGLEWLFRLVTEPRRLWRRYLYHNPRFVALFAAQLARTYLKGE
ncbi:MAG TPA: WecB/TagA/CpsF family glycosyltransferase [Thermomicrobiales bacterium]|nr:WecB/TagA/CpsF family glycosyltransferase [Thermomicrobiales bacterium]